MLTILPWPWGIIRLAASWLISKAAVRLTDSVASHLSLSVFQHLTQGQTPALLTRTSIEPSRSTHVDTTRIGLTGNGDVGFDELEPTTLGLDQPTGGAVVVGEARDEDVGTRLGQGGAECLAESGVAAGDHRIATRQREPAQLEVADVHRADGTATEQSHRESGVHLGCRERVER